MNHTSICCKALSMLGQRVLVGTIVPCLTAGGLRAGMRRKSQIINLCNTCRALISICFGYKKRHDGELFKSTSLHVQSVKSVKKEQQYQLLHQFVYAFNCALMSGTAAISNADGEPRAAHSSVPTYGQRHVRGRVHVVPRGGTIPDTPTSCNKQRYHCGRRSYLTVRFNSQTSPFARSRYSPLSFSTNKTN